MSCNCWCPQPTTNVRNFTSNVRNSAYAGSTLRRKIGAMIHVTEICQIGQEDTKSVQEVSSGLIPGRRGKTHSDHWLKKVFRPKFRTKEGVRESPLFSVKIQHAGRRETISLHTSNTADAARKAKQAWVKIVANGWEIALIEFKPETHKAPEHFSTVGEFLAFVELNHLYPPDTLFNQERGDLCDRVSSRSTKNKWLEPLSGPSRPNRTLYLAQRKRRSGPKTHSYPSEGIRKVDHGENGHLCGQSRASSYINRGDRDILRRRHSTKADGARVTITDYQC